MDKPKNYLGIDWGEAVLGLALAHAETHLAVAYRTLKNDEHLISELKRVLSEEAIGTVVIGTPEHPMFCQEGSGGKRLGKVLEEQLGVAVFYENEMFTTALAQQVLRKRGEKAVGEKDDAEAARIILGAWLDRKKDAR